MTDKITEIIKSYPNSLFSIDIDGFNASSLEVFEYQYDNNVIYRRYCDYLRKQPGKIHSYKEIPFLPIQFFKTHAIQSGNWKAQETFLSSGTTGVATSKHLVRNVKDYQTIAMKAFREVYGDLENYAILALLPSYLERSGSSLIHMVKTFIDKQGHNYSGFFLNDYKSIHEQYIVAQKNGLSVIIWGVSYALLDLALNYDYDFSESIVIETGGMKGRGKELVRSELHQILQEGLNTHQIHSEYGMTELLSQCYSKQNGIFTCPGWMDVIVTEVNDPFQVCEESITGNINIIDLGNIHSCSFIATQDLGKKHQNGTFEILGRLDNSDIRGCNLMIN